MDIVEFLRARLDEDERLAKAALPAPWQSGPDGDPEGVHYGEFGWYVSGAGVEAEDSEEGKATAQHIAYWDPARVLAEVAAKRWIIDALDALIRDPARLTDPELHYRVGVLNEVAMVLAQPFAEHPDFDPMWKVSA